jgi:alpha-1,2-mannosyltransferase
MLEKVGNRVADFNNQGAIAKSPVLSFIKLRYYKLFALLYGYVGSYSDIVMVN